VDDSEFEVQSVRALLPEVTSILYDRKTVAGELAECIRLSDRVSYKNVKARQNTYVTNRLREELQANCSSFEEYLESLKMKVDIHIAVETELNRISELTQRANQYTNGVRCSVDNLKDFITNGGKLYAVYVKDKYSDLGLVGAIGINNGCLNLFVLSCRSLGRKVEDKMLDYVREYGIHKIIYLNTGKNNVFKSRLIVDNFQILQY